MFNKKTKNNNKQKKSLDLEFLKLMSSRVQFSDLISAIHQLQNMDVLSLEEQIFCSKILEQIEMNNKIDIYAIAKEMEFDDIPDDIKGYEEVEYFNQVDDFIKKRKELFYEADCAEALGGVKNNNITKKITNLVFERYSSIIDIPEEDNYNNLEKLEEPSKEEISTAIKSVDDTLGGLPNGLTVIVGGEGIGKSMWALNIGYQAITSNKNVLYFALGCSEENIYQRLLERHSCNKDKFEKEFCFEDLRNDYDVTNYKVIYNDFKNTCLSNLIIFDEKQFLISTHYNLQKLIVAAQKRFIQNTDNGIDLIIIDDFSYMKLDKGRQCITTQEVIVNEYFNYLRDQSKNLLGTKKKIPILVTISPNKNAKYMDVGQLYNNVISTIRLLSDNIFVTNSNSILQENNMLAIGVLQTFNGKVLKEEHSIKCNYKQWCIQYEEDEKSTKQKLKDKEEEAENLEKELEELKKDFSKDFSALETITNIDDNKNITLNFS